MRAKRHSSRLAILPLVLCAMALCGAPAQAEPPSLHVLRTIEFKAIGSTWEDLPGNHGRAKIEGTLALADDGSVSGAVTSAFYFNHGDKDCAGVPWIWQGETTTNVTGTFRDQHLTLSTPHEFAATQSGHSSTPEKKCFAFADPLPATLPLEWAEFELQLTDGRYGPVTVTGEPAGTNVRATVTTTAEMTGLSQSGVVAMKAEHDIVPAHLAYYNKVSFQVPDNDATRNRPSLAARIEVATVGRGRLLRQPGYSGEAKEITLSGVKPGQWYDLYYAWRSSDPPSTVHRETVWVQISDPGSKAAPLTGEVSFDVGIDFEVVSVNRLLAREIRLGQREPVLVRVRDAMHPDRNAGALAKELGLRPVLLNRQTGFYPATSLDQLIIGLSLNWSGVGELVLNQALWKSDAFASGDHLEWDVDGSSALNGQGLYQGEAYPYLLFRTRGMYTFDFDILNVAYHTPYDTGILADPASRPIAARFAATKLDPESDFFFNALLPCCIGLGSEPTASQLWSCLQSVLNSDLGQGALADHVLLNTFAIWASDMVDAAGQLADAVDVPQTAEEAQQQLIEQIQSVAADLSDAVVAVIDKRGVKGLQAQGDRTGLLRVAPAKGTIVSASKAAKGGAGAASGFDPASRIVIGAHTIAVATNKGERITLALQGGGESGDIVVVSQREVTRLRPPAGTWTATLAIAADGTVTTTGTPLERVDAAAQR